MLPANEAFDTLIEETGAVATELLNCLVKDGIDDFH